MHLRSRRRVYRLPRGPVKSAGLVLLGLVLLGAQPEDRLDRSRKLEETLGTLRSAFERGRVDSVLTVFETELAGRELTARLHGLHGLSLAAVGRHREAVQAYEKGIVQAYGRAELHQNLAVSLLELGVTGRAMAEFEEAVELAPTSVDAHLGYGRSLSRFQRWEEAREVLDRAHDLDPTDARVQRARAELADQRGDTEQAREIWSWLEQRRPSADSARRLGELSGDAAVALEHFEACAQRDPSALDCRERAAALHLQAGRPERTVELVAPLVERLSPAGYENLLLAHQSLGELEALEAVVETRAPATGRGWAVVALARRAGGRTEAALEAVRGAFELAPQDLDVANLLAVLLLESGDRDGARARWEWILERDPDHPDARRNLEGRFGG